MLMTAMVDLDFTVMLYLIPVHCPVHSTTAQSQTVVYEEHPHCMEFASIAYEHQALPLLHDRHM